MAKEVSSTKYSNKLLGLEAVRFSVALSVLFWHYRHFSYYSDSPINFIRAQQPFYNLFKILYDYGHYGVQVFWCISGFIFFWKYHDLIPKNLVSGKRFFILRFSRLYPLHFITFILVALMQFVYYGKYKAFFVYQYNDFRHAILQLFLASSWGVERGFSYNGPIWSISAEILIYVVFFIVLKFVGRSIWINIAVLLFWSGITCLGYAHPILECLVFFYIGGIACKLHSLMGPSVYKPKILIIGWIILCTAPIIVLKFQLYKFPFFMTPFLMAYSTVLLVCTAQDWSFSSFSTSIIEAAGNMTYSSYLIHFPLQLFIVLVFRSFNIEIPLYRSYFFILFTMSTLLLSYLIYRYLEAPLQSLIRKSYK